MKINVCIKLYKIIDVPLFPYEIKVRVPNAISAKSAILRETIGFTKLDHLGNNQK